MSAKQRREGTGAMPMSESAREMMVCICPRKKRAEEGLRAPGCASTASSAALSCGGVE